MNAVEKTINQITNLLIICLFPMAALAQSPPRYQEAEGIVLIEIESAANYGTWEFKTSVAGHTGDGYLHYKGNLLSSKPSQRD